MASRRGLTGGTNDVNPQWFKIQTTQSGADTTTTSSFPLPVPRLASPSSPTVFEILAVYWFLHGAGWAEVDSQVTAALTTKSFGTTAVAFNEGTLIDRVREKFSLTTSGSTIQIEPIIHELDDGAGHGILVATDNIFLQVSSATSSLSNIVDCWIKYRLKRVALSEYIGIVQSQQ